MVTSRFRPPENSADEDANPQRTLPGKTPAESGGARRSETPPADAGAAPARDAGRAPKDSGAGPSGKREESRPASRRASSARRARPDGAERRRRPQNPKSGAASGKRDESESLRELRQLLFAEEARRIEQVEREVRERPVSAAQVEPVLVEAIELRQNKDAQGLGRSLAPSFDKAFKRSVQQHPEEIAEAISPVIGPAIRSSIRNAISSLVESFNRTLDHSLSPRSIGWRLEAWRTGKSFGEVVLLRTLEYRVEDLLLIEKESGVLLQHLSNGIGPSDPDMVSGLLTALRDYAADSFNRAPEGTDSARSGPAAASTGAGARSSEFGVQPQRTLDSFQVGDLKVWLADGPHAVLAAVVRGHPPQSYKNDLQDTVDLIHKDFAREFAEFDGDCAPLAGALPKMELCLQEAKRPGHERRGLGAAVWVGLALLVGLVALAIWAGFSWRENSARREAWRGYVADLEKTAGLFVISHEADIDGDEGEQFRVSGLRDAVSEEPAAILARSGLDPAWVDNRWELYESRDPAIVLERARRRLAAPASVQLQLEDNGVLRLEGKAPSSWIASSRSVAPSIAGVQSIDSSRLEAEDREAILFERIRDVLQPPQTTRLVLEDGILRAEGRASADWVAEACLLARTLESVERFELEGLEVPDEAPDPMLRIRAVLAPPASVTLVLDEKNLSVSGHATRSWAERAVWAARVLHEVESVDMSGLEVDEDPELLRERALLAFRPPPGVEIRIDDGVVHVSGSASLRWLEESKRLALRVQGLESSDFSRVEVPSLDRFDSLAASLSTLSIEFGLAVATVSAPMDETIDDVAEKILGLVEEANREGFGIRVEVIGNTQDRVLTSKGRALGRARSRAVVEALISRGVPASLLASTEAAAIEAPIGQESPHITRRVTFQVRRIE